MKAGTMLHRTAAEIALDRAMHAAFIQWETPQGLVPSRSVYDIRAHRRFPWRILARLIVSAERKRVQFEAVMRCIAALESFARQVYGKPGPTSGGGRVLQFPRSEEQDVRRVA